MLQIKKENLEKSKIKLTVSVPSVLTSGYANTVFNKMAADVEVKGFRKGKAPKHLAIMQIGENRLISEIINLALSETYTSALKQEKIIPVSNPKIDVTKMADLLEDNAVLEYTAEIDVLPEVKIGDYKKIKLPKESKIEIKKEEIDQVLSHLQRQHADFKDVDRACKDKDKVEIDFVGQERGVPIENLTNKNYPVILGTKVLIPDFEKNIIGMKKGAEKEFTVELEDKTTNKKDAKKKIDFKVKMLDIKEVILPELNDELAKKFGKDTIEELATIITADIENQKKGAMQREREGKLIEELLKISKLDVPESLVDQEVHRMIDQLKQQTEISHIPFEKYLESIKKTEEDLHNDFKVQAEKTVKIGLVLGEIGKIEKVDLSKEDAGKKVIESLMISASKK